MANDEPPKRPVPPDVRALLVARLAAALAKAWKKKHAPDDPKEPA